MRLQALKPPLLQTAFIIWDDISDGTVFRAVFFVRHNRQNKRQEFVTVDGALCSVNTFALKIVMYL